MAQSIPRRSNSSTALAWSKMAMGDECARYLTELESRSLSNLLDGDSRLQENLRPAIVDQIAVARRSASEHLHLNHCCWPSVTNSRICMSAVIRWFISGRDVPLPGIVPRRGECAES